MPSPGTSASTTVQPPPLRGSQKSPISPCARAGPTGWTSRSAGRTPARRSCAAGSNRAARSASWRGCGRSSPRARRRSPSHSRGAFLAQRPTRPTKASRGSVPFLLGDPLADPAGVRHAPEQNPEQGLAQAGHLRSVDGLTLPVGVDPVLPQNFLHLVALRGAAEVESLGGARLRPARLAHGDALVVRDRGGLYGGVELGRTRLGHRALVFLPQEAEEAHHRAGCSSSPLGSTLASTVPSGARVVLRIRRGRAELDANQVRRSAGQVH